MLQLSQETPHISADLRVRLPSFDGTDCVEEKENFRAYLPNFLMKSTMEAAESFSQNSSLILLLFNHGDDSARPS